MIPQAAMQVRPTAKMVFETGIFISSHVAVTIGATIQKAATALPVKVAAITEASVNPSMTMVMEPLEILWTVSATRRIA